jgi:hypothetical protein
MRCACVPPPPPPPPHAPRAQVPASSLTRAPPPLPPPPQSMGTDTWTQALYDLAVAVEAGAEPAAAVDVRVEGPYGRAPCDADGRTPEGLYYDAVVLVGGGIGVTPLMSLWAAARAAAPGGGGRSCGRWHFVWSARSPALIGAFSEALDAPCARPGAFTVALHATGDGATDAAETPATPTGPGAAGRRGRGGGDSAEYYGATTPKLSRRLLGATSPPQHGRVLGAGGGVTAQVVSGRPDYTAVLRGVAASVPGRGAAAAAATTTTTTTEVTNAPGTGTTTSEVVVEAMAAAGGHEATAADAGASSSSSGGGTPRPRVLVWVCGPSSMQDDVAALCAAETTSAVEFVFEDTTFCW